MTLFLRGIRVTSRTRVALLCIACGGPLALGVLRPSEALAQAPAPKLTAQKKAREGRRLADLGQHDAALALFKQAYDTQPDPGYLYNIATELQTLARDVEALETFDRFLRDAQGIAPEFIADAHQQRKDLRQRLGEIDIHCTQDGAHITVDNEDRGVTPKDQPLFVAPGSHRVTVTKDGFQPFTTEVVANKGSHASVEAPLQPVQRSATERASGAAAGGTAPGPPASGPGTGESARADSGASPFGEQALEPSEAAAPGPSRWHAMALAGVTIWSGVPNAPEPSAHFGLSAGYAVLRLSQRADVRLGVKGGFTFLSERSGKDLFLSALVDPMVTYELIQHRLRAFFDVGLGVLVMSGVHNDSVLLSPTAGAVTGALATFELHPAIGLAYALTPWLSLFASPSVAFSPRPSPYFENPSLWRVEFGGGAMFHP